MASGNQTPRGYKFAPFVAIQQRRAIQHEPACLLGHPLLGLSRYVQAYDCVPYSSPSFLYSDPFHHEMFRPLFRRSAPFPLVLGCSRPSAYQPIYLFYSLLRSRLKNPYYYVLFIQKSHFVRFWDANRFSFKTA